MSKEQIDKMLNDLVPDEKVKESAPYFVNFPVKDMNKDQMLKIIIFLMKQEEKTRTNYLDAMKRKF